MKGLMSVLVVFAIYVTGIQGKDFFTNNSEPVCMSLVTDDDISNGIIDIIHEHMGILVSFFTGSNGISNDKRVINHTLDRNEKSASFCLVNITSLYAGKYYFSNDNKSVSTLYILVKPSLPTITVNDTGTVGKADSSIHCISRSNSLPKGLDLSYIWKANGMPLEENQKYTFKDDLKSILVIKPSRTEKEIRYTCIAVETKGQLSESSIFVTVDPERAPIVVLRPDGKDYRLIENESISLECIAKDGKPDTYSYKWFKNNYLLPNESESTWNRNTIKQVDSGGYKCSAENIVEEISTNSIQLDIMYGPIISDIAPHSQEEGHSLSILCNVSSNPLIEDENITWSRPNNNSFHSIGRRLHIRNVNMVDDGIFICSCNITFRPTNGTVTTNNSSTSLLLNVLFGPKMELLSTYAQIEGRNTNVLCNVSSNPQVTAADIKWMKNSEFIINGFYLIFDKVRRENGGQYTCTANVYLNVSGGYPVNRSTTKVVVLNVLYGPEILMNKRVNEIKNRSINITCNINANPSPLYKDIHWLRNDEQIQEGPNLILASATQDQIGFYNCSVDLILHPTEGKSEQRTATAEIFLDVLYGPEVLDYDALPTTEGNLLLIFCNATSNPKAKHNDVVWTKVGNDSFRRSGEELRFHSVSRKDLGQYICNVSIQLIPTKGLPEERNGIGRVNVTVHYQPYILNVTNVNIYEGSHTQINCSVDGNPAPSIIWTYIENGTTIEEHERLTDDLISTSSILISRCEDTGVYRCQADNKIKFATNKTAAIVVNCRPRLSYLRRSTVTIGRNDTLNLTVMFHAVPEPTFIWSFNNSDLSGFQMKRVHNLPYSFGSRLTKKDFEESDIGQYSINATNEIGSVSENVIILYEREPYRPILLDLQCQEVQETAKIVWMSPGNGGRPQNFTILYRTINQVGFSNSHIYNESKNSLEYTEFVFNLQGNTEYIFKIKAKNDIGYKMSKERNCTVLDAMEQSSVLTIIGSVCGTAAGFVVACTVFFIHRKRRNQPNTEQAQTQRKMQNDEDDDEGLKDNPLYVQSGPAGEYAITYKRNEESISEEKKTKKKLRLGIEKTRGRGKQIEMAEIYENSEDIVKNLEGPVNGNVNRNVSTLSNETYEPKKNKDGLLYADLEFNPSSSRFVIRGLENRSCYADIDFTQKGEPLPPDSDDDEKTNGENVECLRKTMIIDNVNKRK